MRRITIYMLPRETFHHMFPTSQVDPAPTVRRLLGDHTIKDCLTSRYTGIRRQRGSRMFTLSGLILGQAHIAMHHEALAHGCRGRYDHIDLLLEQVASSAFGPTDHKEKISHSHKLLSSLYNQGRENYLARSSLKRTI